MKHLPLLGLLAFALHEAASPGAAFAVCGESPPFQVMWTYPEDGAADVPVNAQFWIDARAGELLAAELDGELVPALHFANVHLVRPRELAANAEHALVLHFQRYANDGDPPKHEVRIGFRTGASRAEAPAAPTVAGHTWETTDAPGPDLQCGGHLTAGQCLDTSFFLVRYEAQSPGVQAVLISGPSGPALGATLWPTRCGEPHAFIERGPETQFARCAQFHAIGPGGLLSEPTDDCPEPTSDAGVPGDAGARDAGGDAAPPASKDGSCALPAGPAASSWSLMLLALLAWLFRRRQARRRGP